PTAWVRGESGPAKMAHPPATSRTGPPGALHPRALAASAASIRLASSASAKNMDPPVTVWRTVAKFSAVRQKGAWAHHIDMATQNLQLAVRGMTCGSCARTVERTLTATPGVTKASVDLPSASATVEYDANLVKPEVLAEAVRDLGYDVP